MGLEEIKDVKKLEVELLWHSEYWDGPRSGLCLVDNQKLWFNIVHESLGELCEKDEECSKLMERNEDFNEEEFCPTSQEECWKIPPQRYFGVYEIKTEILEEKERRHKLFQKYVGTHTDYLKGKRELEGTVKPQKSWKHYYEKAKEWPELDCKQKLIGYFIL